MKEAADLGGNEEGTGLWFFVVCLLACFGYTLVP